MNSLEIIALVFVIIALIKLLVLSVSPKSWMNFVKKLYRNQNLLLIAELILAGLVFYYLLQELTVIQIMGGIVIGALLTGITFAVYGRELMPTFVKVFSKGNMLKKAWLPILIWLALIVWILKALFF